MEWWRWEGWPTAEEWQAWWAFMTVVVAAAAAWFALRQYRASIRSQVEQARPYVIVDFHFIRGGVVAIEVKNSGLTAAEDVRFEWSARPQAENPRQQAAIDRTLLAGGLPFLAPGRAVRLLLGAFTEDRQPRQYRVTATYRGSGDGEEWTSSSILDMDQWAEALADRDPYETLVKPLKELAADARHRRLGGLGVPIEKRAAESLHAYFEAQPEVKRYRRKRARRMAEEDRTARENLERSVRLASEEEGPVNDTQSSAVQQPLS